MSEIAGSAHPQTAARAAELARFVGQPLTRVTMRVEAGKVAEFARALHDPNPIYRDPEAARSAGFSNVPAPPTFSTVLAHYPLDSDEPRSPAAAVVAHLGLRRERTLNGAQRWTYERVPVAGDDLTATVVVTSVESRDGKSGNSFVSITAATEYRDRRDELVLSETVTLLELADVPR